VLHNNDSNRLGALIDVHEVDEAQKHLSTVISRSSKRVIGYKQRTRRTKLHGPPRWKAKHVVMATNGSDATRRLLASASDDDDFFHFTHFSGIKAPRVSKWQQQGTFYTGEASSDHESVYPVQDMHTVECCCRAPVQYWISCCNQATQSTLWWQTSWNSANV